MSWHHVGDLLVRGRREHRCCLCGLRIRRRARHVKRFGYGEDGPVTVRMHEICESRTRDWSEDEWEYTDEAEFREYLFRGMKPQD